MTIIEWMAAIIAIVAVIKILVILIKPKAWMSVVKPIYANSVVLMIVGIILAGGSLYYLLDSGITIVQIFAVMFLLMALMLLSVAAYNKELVGMANKMLKNRGVLRKGWLAMIVWLVLSVWAIKELFF